MSDEIHNQCDLRLIKMVFDKLEFDRKGFKNNEDPKLGLKVDIGKNDEKDVYKVALTATITKEKEYNLKVKISGYFSVNSGDSEKNEILINQNAVAILMPYVRSQITLLTAQPDTECVILPPMNILSLLNSDSEYVLNDDPAL